MCFWKPGLAFRQYQNESSAANLSEMLVLSIVGAADADGCGERNQWGPGRQVNRRKCRSRPTQWPKQKKKKAAALVGSTARRTSSSSHVQSLLEVAMRSQKPTSEERKQIENTNKQIKQIKLHFPGWNVWAPGPQASFVKPMFTLINPANYIPPCFQLLTKDLHLSKVQHLKLFINS